MDFTKELLSPITVDNLAHVRAHLAVLAVKAEQTEGAEHLAGLFDRMRQMLGEPRFSTDDFKRLMELKKELDQWRAQYSEDYLWEKQTARDDILFAALRYNKDVDDLAAAKKSLVEMEKAYRKKYFEPSQVLDEDFMAEE